MPGRSNGLPATRYTPLVDLEPQLADALLEALRDEGVAAYAAPSPGVKGPYLDVQLPDGPTDRVWVDAGARTRAREILSARLPEFQDALGEEHGTSHAPGALASGGSSRPASETRPAADDDEAWQAIVAGWDLASSDPVPPWPASEDVADDTPPAGAPSATGGPAAPARPDDRPRRLGPETGPTPPPRGAGSALGGHRVRPLGPDEGMGVGPPTPVPPSGFPPGTAFPTDSGPTDSLDDEDDPEDHYVPPPPPPLPRLDPLTKLAWVGVLGAPLYLLLAHLLNWVPIEGSTVLALFAFVGGFVGLVYRMKDDRGDDGGTDDGAVV